MRLPLAALTVPLVVVLSGCPLSTSPYGRPCDAAQPCDEPYVCVDVTGAGAQCVPPALIDGGAMDAGRVDAGAGTDDAGVLDAGVDASTDDAGRDDAGALDAGGDVGTTDSGSADGGTADSGVGPVDAGPGSGLWLRVVMERGPEADADLHVMRGALSEYCGGTSDCYVYPCQSAFQDTDWDGDGVGGGSADPIHTTFSPPPDAGLASEVVESHNAPAGRYYVVVDRWPNNFVAVDVSVHVYAGETLRDTIERRVGIDSQTWVVAELELPADGGPWVVTPIDECHVSASCIQETIPDGGLAPEACTE